MIIQESRKIKHFSRISDRNWNGRVFVKQFLSSIKVCSLSVEYRYEYMTIDDSAEIVRLAKYYVVFDLKSYFRSMTDIETGRC